VSFIHPHDPYVARPEFWDLYDHDEIDLPTTQPAGGPHSLRVRAGIEADTDLVTDDEIRNARHAYYANVSYVDSKIGEIIQTLEEAQLLDETIVVFTADHGEMLGERGLWYKMTMLEPSVRVPLVMAGPGIVHRAVGEPCSLVDLLPTMLDMAMGEDAWPPLGADLDGRSLLGVAGGGVEDSEATAVAEYCAECTSHPIVMIRRGSKKFIWCPTDPPQLYDVVADPMELTNLADTPEFEPLV
ncbi:MAG: sulfatase-like hydrolase/transferase, partial [Actinomycetia bacterium]|nr:sulfatase-like hydrolase/transferase [Actinomycetes bacterium]